MAPKQPDATAGPFSAPDAMLSVWSAWMDAATSSAGQWTQQQGEAGGRWWQAKPDATGGHTLASLVEPFNEALAKDPVLHSIDQMWNANPLREVVPVDWAEIAHALRTIWMRSLRNPAQAVSSAMELNARVLTAATDIGTRPPGGG